MAYFDASSLARLARQLERVLILEPNPTSARLLYDLLRSMGAREILIEPNDANALATCARYSPQVIFTELHATALDGLAFTRNLRRSGLGCRKAPVIIVTAEATAPAILGARNAGVHEFLRKPYTTRDLQRRIEAAVLSSRDWIEAVAYVGPDRRRFNSGDYQGRRKRQTDAEPMSDAARITQALQILKAALAAIETDPAQALRSIQAQAADLRAAALSSGRLELAAAAAHLQRHLSALTAERGLNRPTIEAAAASLLAFLPPEAEARAPADAAA